MGCCGSTSLSEPSLTYTVELYEIQSADKSYSYKFEKRSSETIEKQEESTIENDLNGCGNNLISNITSDTTIQQNSMFYLYIGRDLIFKNYKDIYQIFPYKYPTLVKIIVILINEAINDGIEKDLIKKGIELLDNFPKGIINLEKIKEKYDISQNPNITNDNLNLSNDDNSDVDDELNIDDEEITEHTLNEINNCLFNINKEKNNDIDNEFKNDLNCSKNKIFKEKFKDNSEYKTLCDLINQKDFDEKMKYDEEFRNSIFLNKFFLYNEKSHEIINKYSYLLPKYIYNIIKGKFENNKDNIF
jgi:hypothetical protein